MRLNVKVKLFSHEEKIIQSENGVFTVCVKEPPSEGRANAAVVKMLSKHFKVPKSSIAIISGYKSRNKVIEIK